MKRVALAFALLVSSQALASPETYKLNLELSIGEGHLTRTTLIVREGQQAIVSQRRDDDYHETSISAVVTRVPGKKRAVKVEVEIDESRGRTRTVLAKPAVIARLGEHATLEMKSPDPEKSVKLSVTTTIRR